MKPQAGEIPAVAGERTARPWPRRLEPALACAAFHAALFAALALASLGLAVVAVTGLALGLAFDLLLDRFYTGQPATGPIHRCLECRAPLRPLFAVPLAGYAWHAGRCPDCRTALPVRALALPAGAAALFLLSYVVFDDLGPALLGGLFATIFLALTFTDIEQRLLPNRIVYPAVVLAAALSWAWPHISTTEALVGGGVGAVIALAILLFSLPFGGEAFGMGDVKMIVLIGFVVGVPSVLVAVLIGTIAAGLFAAVLVVTRLRSTKDYIPHGPFLALGGVLALFWGADLWMY